MKALIGKLAAGLTIAILAGVVAATANAQGTNEKAFFTTTEQLDVGGTILEPGTYEISVVPGRLNRNMLRIWNADRSELFATILSVPHPEGAAEEMVPENRYVYYPASANNVKALRTWFAPNTPASGGHDIVYPQSRALELAVLAEEPVVAVPDEVQEAELETAPLVVVTPKKEVTPYEEPPKVQAPPPVRVAERLPQTASNVPMWAGLGLLSLVAALGLGVLARKLA
jgi:hypothetical protein